jgi:hypothetical protein
VIVGSVLRNNQATDTTDGWGGALLAWDGAPVTIEGSDIYSNTAQSGGAIYNTASCSFTTVPDVMLGSLWDNGGRTLTHMPQPGSLAIDFVAGGCPPPATDQRGAKRPTDGDGNGSARCDAGAVEYSAAVALVYLPLVRK